MSHLELQATLDKQRVSPRESLRVRLRLRNGGKELVRVPAPAASPALHLVLRGPAGEQVAVPGAHPPPGVPVSRSTVALAPDRHHDSGLELADLFDLTRAGPYVLQVEYEPAEGERAAPPPLAFTVLEPAGRWARLVPADAEATGPAQAIWAEADGKSSRLLSFDLGSPLATLKLEIPTTAIPAFSVTEPGAAWNDRWVAWAEDSAAHLAYTGGGFHDALAPRRLPLADVVLVGEPLLARTAGPQRPTCTIAVVAGGALRFVEVDSQGAMKEGAALPLPHAPARVLCSQTRDGAFVALIGVQGVTLVRLGGGRAPALETWLPKLEGALVASDLRGTSCGLVLAQAKGHSRITFAVPKPGEAATPHAEPAGPASIVCARLDAKGRLYALVTLGGAPGLLRPGEAQPTPLEDAGRLLRDGDLSFPLAGGATALLYDGARGPLVRRIS